MKGLSVALLLGFALPGLAVPRVPFQECAAAEDEKNIVCLQINPMPHESLKPEDLPINWDWRNVDGQNLVVPSLNQHIPKYCGACWIFATVHAISDRIKIMRKGMSPEITLAPQVLLNCAKKLKTSPWENFNCQGGMTSIAYQYMSQFGLPDNTCAPYESVERACDDEGVCKNCFHNTSCVAVKSYTSYRLGEFGTVSGEHAMMSEIWKRGPITCRIAVADDLFDYKGGIYNDKTREQQIRHAVEVLGFGVAADGTKYWIARNSWGDYWGEVGFFKIIRGVNNLNIEEGGCMWGVPTWSEKALRKGIVGELAAAEQANIQVAETDDLLLQSDLAELDSSK